MPKIEAGNEKNNERGFSVIELLIVVLIISIIVTLALPSVQRTLQLYRLETGASFVAQRLTEARLAAIKRNRDTWLEINSTTRTLTVKSTNDAAQTITLGYPMTLPDSVQMTGTIPASVIFSSLGRNRANANTALNLRLAAANRNKTITVGATGNITITSF
jgi:type IV fimbrial biogenesis protein FimT